MKLIQKKNILLKILRNFNKYLKTDLK